MNKLLALLVLGFSATAFGADDPRVVRVDRLEKLASYIENLPQKRLYMHSFTGTADSDDPQSVGCALFHGTATAMFRKDGLVPMSYIGTLFAPSFDSLAPMQSAEKFFGVTPKDALLLFGGEDMTPKEEARTLRVVAARERLRLARIEARGLCELAGW